MHSADLVDTSPLASFVPAPTRRFKSFVSVLLTYPIRLQTARLHHRPSVQPTATATSKQADTFAEVTTAESGPDASKLP